jgi:hypothetical protein
MINFFPIRFDYLSLSRYESLFSTCFSKTEKFKVKALRWLYVENPDGPAIGFDAFDGEQLVAHYVCIPTTIRVNGGLVKALLSLNTATHPLYQGKGLFTKLADMTFQSAAELGFHCVYGIANANSTPGFVRKLGFQLVQALEAKVGLGALGTDFEMSKRNAQFERVWAPKSLAWRCGNPVNQVFGLRLKKGLGFHAHAFGRILPAYAEIPSVVNFHFGKKSSVSPFRLFLGLVPQGSSMVSGYVDIPRRLRPSPLNMIFRSLSQSATRLDAGHISFSFLDFDAY